jgi:hypothetical protein
MRTLKTMPVSATLNEVIYACEDLREQGHEVAIKCRVSEVLIRAGVRKDEN